MHPDPVLLARVHVQAKRARILQEAIRIDRQTVGMVPCPLNQKAAFAGADRAYETEWRRRPIDD